MTGFARRPVRRQRAGFVAALLLSVAFGGCTADMQRSAITVVDSAGVTVITSRASAGGDAGWSLGRDPELRIGTAQGDPHYELYRVVGVHRMDDGRIVVANAGTGELRFYGPSGEWIATAGGTGEGPGEFRQMTTMVVAADSIWVWDLALDRVSVFDGAGAFVRTILLAQTEEGPPPEFVGRLADGRLLLGQYVRFWVAHPEPGVQPIPIRYEIADPDGGVLKQLGEFEAGIHLVQVRDDHLWSISVPFGRLSYFTPTDDGFLFGTGERFEVRQYGASGGLRRVMRLDRTPDPVGSGSLEAWIAAVAALRGDADARRILRQRYDGVPLPATRPTYTAVKMDALGNVWAKDYSLPGEEPSRWTVFDSAGVYVGAVTMPEGFEPHQIGADFLLGVSTDSLGVETAEVFSLDRGG